MASSAAATTAADLGDALLDNGSADQVWDEHVGGASGPDRGTAAHDIEQWQAQDWETLTVLDPEYPVQVRVAHEVVEALERIAAADEVVHTHLSLVSDATAW